MSDQQHYVLDAETGVFTNESPTPSPPKPEEVK